MFKTSNSNINKLFVTNLTDTVFSVEINVADYSVIDVSNMDIEKLVMERDAYITDRTKFLTLTVVNYT